MRVCSAAGDFHQLPPVAKGREAAATRKFCFQAACWPRCISACVQLRTVFRQASPDRAWPHLPLAHELECCTSLP